MNIIDGFRRTKVSGLVLLLLTLAVSATPATAQHARERLTPESATQSSRGVGRVTGGLLSLYTFNDGGTSVLDVSGVGTALDLPIPDPLAAVWLPGGGLTLLDATLIATPGPATKLTAGITLTNELTLEAWVSPASINQNGPARIATLSESSFQRNVTLGQGVYRSATDQYVVRLRTTATTLNGIPSLKSGAGTLTTGLCHLVFTRDAAGTTRIYIDGVERASGSAAGDLSNWDPGFRLGLGREFDGFSQVWLGSYRLLAVYDRALSPVDVAQNLAAGVVNNVAPTSAFFATPLSGDVPVVVQFDATASSDEGSIVSYSWDFGDGSTEVTTSPTTSHSYSLAGEHQVSLVVTDNLGLTHESFAALSFTVPPGPPQILVDPANQAVTEGEQATFDVLAQGTAPLAYQWQLWDGLVWQAIAGAVGTSYTTPPAVYPDDNGSQFRCEVSNGVGTFHSAAATLSVSEAPTRVIDGLLAFYPFLEDSGTIVHDQSGTGIPLDLTIEDPGSVAWIPGGGLSLTSAALIASPGPADKINAAVTLSGELSVEAWVAPGNTTQNGPARIVTLSESSFERNVTLAQGVARGASDTFDVRLRSTGTSLNGTPSLTAPAGSLTTALTHVLFTREVSGVTHLYIDGVERASGVASGDLSNWNASFRLALGREFDGFSQVWLGSYRLVAIYSRALSVAEVLQNFAGGPSQNVAPAAFFTADPLTGIVPVTVAFDATLSNDPDGTILQYHWDFGDATEETNAVPTTGHEYTAGGLYQVTLTVTDDQNAIGTAQTTLNLSAAPEPPVILTDPQDQIVQEGEQASFSVVAGGTAPFGYQWQRQDATIWADVPGATASGYTTGPTVLPADASVLFRCVVTNPLGSVASNAATLSVEQFPGRVMAGLIALYRFRAGSGTIVFDESGVVPVLDLSIPDPTAVTWLAGGGLRIDSATLIATDGPASKLNAAFQSSGEFTLEAWVIPANTTQNGPARVVTLSADSFERNVTLAQGVYRSTADKYTVRLRSTVTSLNGIPSVSTPDGSLTTSLTHVVVLRGADGTTKIYLDGVERASRDDGGDLSGWDPLCRLGLGREFDGTSQSWLGTYRSVAFYDRALSAVELAHNFTIGPPSGTFTLTTGTVGSGKVFKNPNKELYADGDLVLVQAHSDPGWSFSHWTGDLTGSENPSAITMTSDMVVTAVFVDDAPVISGIQVTEISDNSALVSWTTDVPATSAVLFGPTVAYENGAVEDLTLVLQHAVRLSGLNRGTEYHFSVSSQNAAGAGSAAADVVFNTLPASLESDDFNACALDPSRWSFIDPLGNSSFWMSGAGSGDAHLIISVPAGASHDPGDSNTAARVMQNVPDTDFEVMTRFLSSVTERFQIQGILIQQDPANFIRVDYSYTGSVAQLYVGTVVDSVSSEAFTLSLPAGPPEYLVVGRIGNQWTAYYSYDGVGYTPAGSFLHPLTVYSAGVFGGNFDSTGNAPAHTAIVDFFFDVFAPVDPEDGTLFPADKLLTVNTVGLGAVNQLPDSALYYCGQLVDLTAVPAEAYQFDGWSGDLVGTNNPESLWMLEDRSVTATFIANSPPVISNVTVQASESTTLINWTTDEPATSVVAYGASAGYELGVVEDLALSTSHTIALDSLNADTLYHFQISSADVAGMSSSTTDDTFMTLPVGSGNTGLTSDDFNQNNLQLGVWQFIDPLGDSEVSITGVGTANAQLRITVPGGPSHDPWVVNTAPRVTQTMLDTDFTVEARFESIVDMRYQIQGLMIEQTPQKFIRFDFSFDGSRVLVFAATLTDGVPVTRASILMPIGIQPEYLRVARSGNAWTLDYSSDGSIWTNATSFAYAMEVMQSGVFAGNFDSTGNAPDHTAVIDYFFETATPIDPEDGGVPQADVQQPFIHHQQYRVGDVSVSLSWATDEPSTSRIDYGLTTAYELGSVEATELTYLHDLLVGSLTPETTYHFRISSTDFDANTGMSTDLPFTTPVAGSGTAPQINVWYGSDQRFGHLGEPQNWINILGNTTDADGLSSMAYSLNGATFVPMSLGPDTRRLQSPGDFNADIALTALAEGLNIVDLRAEDTVGEVTIEQVGVTYTGGVVWPSTTGVNWTGVTDLQDVVQVVDGLWEVTGGQARPVLSGYDRLLALGDVTWDDYEVTAPITIDGIDLAGVSQSCNCYVIGFLLRWPGHAVWDASQPAYGFFPLGAIAGYRWDLDNPAGQNGRLWLAGNEYTSIGEQVYDNSGRTLTLGTEYIFKARVETTPGVGGSLYSLKIWESGSSEPVDWDLTIQTGAEDHPAGSLLLLSHYTNARFGEVTVTPLVP